MTLWLVIRSGGGAHEPELVCSVWTARAGADGHVADLFASDWRFECPRGHEIWWPATPTRTCKKCGAQGVVRFQSVSWEWSVKEIEADVVPVDGGWN